MHQKAAGMLIVYRLPQNTTVANYHDLLRQHLNSREVPFAQSRILAQIFLGLESCMYAINRSCRDEAYEVRK
jgi:hypothetical protein